MTKESIHHEILSFNKLIIESNTTITIRQYIDYINATHYNINITFIDELFELVSRDDCCIPHTYLKKYKISKLTSGSNDVIKLFNKNNFIQDIEYSVRQLAERIKNGNLITNNIYYLRPDAFKKLLMRTRNTKVYCDYYILLERCIKYYNDLQLERFKLNEQSLLTKLDITNAKLYELNDSIKELIQSNNKLNETNKELIQSNNKLNETNKELNTTILTLTNELSSIKLQHMATSYKSIPQVSNEDFEHVFLIFKNTIDTIQYKVSRIQRQVEHTTIKKENSKNYKLISKIDYCTNPIAFTQLLREQLNDVIHFKSVNFTIINKNTTEKEIINLFHKKNNDRLVLYT